MSRADALRVPPNSVDAEQAVLGGVMLSPPAWTTICRILTAEDFYRRDHQLIFQGIEALAEAGKPFDAVTLGDWFEEQGAAELVGNGAYLVDLVGCTPSAANVESYAEIVKDRSKRRQLIAVGTAIVQSGFDPEGRETPEVIAEATSSVMALGRDEVSTGAREARELVSDWIDDLYYRWENPGIVAGMVMPWETVEEVIPSLDFGTLTIIAGRPSMGKSAVAVNLANAFANGDEAGVLYFDYESTGRAIINRAMASRAGVPLKFLRKPRAYVADWAERAKIARDSGIDFRDDDPDGFWPKLTEAVREMKDANLRVEDTPGMSIQRLIASARAEFQKRPFKVMVVDHLHLIPLPGKTRETVEIGHITSSLKVLAKELGIAVVLLAQLNRGVEGRSDRRPKMADLRESGNIEQDADAIIFIYREDYYAGMENRPSPAPGLIELIVAKQREGEVGTGYVRADLRYARVSNITRQEVRDILDGAKVVESVAGSDGSAPRIGRMGSKAAAGAQQRVRASA